MDTATTNAANDAAATLAPLASRKHTARRMLCKEWRRINCNRSAPLLLLSLLAACAALGAIALGAVALVLLRDPTPRFLERRSHLVRWSEGAPDSVDGALVYPVHLVAASGLEVDLLVKRPAAADSTPSVRRPVVVLLGGHVTGRDAAKLIPDTHGAVVAALSYPFRGDNRMKGPKVLLAAPAIRAAILDTPPALMLALDYLLRQPYADSARVEGVGVSFGAPFVCVAGALDRRFTRVWAIHGSGGSYAPLEYNMRRTFRVAPIRVAAARMADLAISGPRLAPERWVARIAPRPFVMVNARDDERLPRPLIERLYASAREPKEIVWVPGRHVQARAEVVKELVEIVLAKIRADERAIAQRRRSTPGSTGMPYRGAP